MSKSRSLLNSNAILKPEPIIGRTLELKYDVENEQSIRAAVENAQKRVLLQLKDKKCVYQNATIASLKDTLPKKLDKLAAEGKKALAKVSTLSLTAFKIQNQLNDVTKKMISWEQNYYKNTHAELSAQFDVIENDLDNIKKARDEQIEKKLHVYPNEVRTNEFVVELTEIIEKLSSVFTGNLTSLDHACASHMIHYARTVMKFFDMIDKARSILLELPDIMERKQQGYENLLNALNAKDSPVVPSANLAVATLSFNNPPPFNPQYKSSASVISTIKNSGAYSPDVSPTKISVSGGSSQGNSSHSNSPVRSGKSGNDSPPSYGSVEFKDSEILVPAAPGGAKFFALDKLAQNKVLPVSVMEEKEASAAKKKLDFNVVPKGGTQQAVGFVGRIGEPTQEQLIEKAKELEVKFVAQCKLINSKSITKVISHSEYIDNNKESSRLATEHFNIVKKLKAQNVSIAYLPEKFPELFPEIPTSKNKSCAIM